MANTYENLAVDNKPITDAAWQAWCQAIEAAFLASGFLEVAPDTGQLNLVTTTRPSVGTYAGYRIYRAKDSLAATKPFYIKVEYGNTGSGQDRPIFRRTSATGSNGTGTLTGPTTTVVASSNSSAGSGVATILGGGGAHSVFVHQLDPGNAGHNIQYAAGRLLDQSDGSATDAILWDAMTSGAGVSYFGSYVWTDGALAWAALGSGLAAHAPDLTSALHNGGDLSITRLFQALVYRNAKTLVFPLVLGKAVELPYTNPTASKFNLNIWGGSHTFIVIPQTAHTTSSNRACLLWE